ncbi:MAG: mechanosensitive ion channel [Flavobacteriales bacterium]|nr:mechanosensitive ion channel [Flavobacteriales bacterium]
MELFTLGDTVITLSSMLWLLGSLIVLFTVSAFIKRMLVSRVFKRYEMEMGMAESVGTITRYAIIILGLVIILQTSGIDMSALGIMFGALGIGIGFGLQNISNNFISGLIILFERPIKVGDRVEVHGVAGNIVNISARATTIITNDNIAIIVPNAQFINEEVINWSHNDKLVRFNIPVGVSYKEDPARIRSMLLEVAAACEGVESHPAPDVLFEKYGESSLDFVLRVWSTDYSYVPQILKSKLYYAMFEKFKENGVEIPYPQRDLHIKSGLESLQGHRG